MSEDDFEIRDGHGVRWQQVNRSCYGETVITGYTIDNLDTKNIFDTENEFETLFVALRGVLEEHSAYCLDNEDERLKLCQSFAVFATRNRDFKFKITRKK
tara:strand:- start:141 stop:440 length:300 start_codon:yes stop_codon:yes gene_type:complete